MLKVNKQINDVTQWFSNLYSGESSFICGSTKDRHLKFSITPSTNDSQTNSNAASCLKNRVKVRTGFYGSVPFAGHHNSSDDLSAN
jgi:hypothetical protein